MVEARLSIKDRDIDFEDRAMFQGCPSQLNLRLVGTPWKVVGAKIHRSACGDGGDAMWLAPMVQASMQGSRRLRWSWS